MSVFSIHRQKRRDKRGARGFTVGEVIAVVAILAILAGLAVPNVVQLQQDLKVSELNSKAQQIYNAAQFQLASLKTAGRLEALATADANTVHPADYPAGAQGADSIRYVVKGSAAADVLFPEDSRLVTSGVTSGDYAIELAYSAGEVYAVYYWEDDATNADGTPVGTANASEAEQFYLAMNDKRTTGEGTYLSAHKVGYYGGGEVSKVELGSSGPEEEFRLSETIVSIENGEELYVHVRSSTGSLRDTDFDPSKLKLSIYVQEFANWLTAEGEYYALPGRNAIVDVNGGAAHPELPSIPSERHVDGGVLDSSSVHDSVDYVLDSMYRDAGGEVMSFANLVGEFVTKGANVEITVFLEYSGDFQKFGPVRKNSAFDNYDPASQTLTVSSIRHIANLNGASGMNVTTLKIDSDIDFDGAKWDEESVAAAHRGNENLNPLHESGDDYEPIAPIDIKDLMGNGNDRVIDGGNHVLRGFVIGDPDNPVDDAGLFRELLVNLKDLTLENPTVCGSENVGALIGAHYSNGVTIENCKVIGGTVTGQKNVGGIAGVAVNSATFRGCSSTASVYATSGGNAGGFVGRSDTCTFADCTVGVAYATSSPTEVVGRYCSNVGGFIGLVQPSNIITGCQVYANVSGYDYVGGFAGKVENGSWSQIENCQVGVSYDTSSGVPVLYDIDGHAYIGGFSGNVVSLTLKGCRAQANVSGSDDYIGGFTGSFAVSGANLVSDCKVTSIEANGVTYAPTYSGPGAHVGPFAGQNDYTGSLEGCTSSARSA